MHSEAALRLGQVSPFEQIRYAREIIHIEQQALAKLAARIDNEFCRAIDHLLACSGSVVVSGMGKAGLIGQKVSATLASTGTRSYFLHPAEAVHGDLGRLRSDDVLLVLSQSGETEEIVRLLPSVAQLGVPLVAMCRDERSTLARAAEVVLTLGPLKEACPLGLAPSTSTTAMLALGDALALVASRLRSFGSDDFARLHPAGALGRRLARVEDRMRPLDQCRVASADATVRHVLVDLRRPGRRSGAIMLVDEAGCLAGLFTDSDLARLLEDRNDLAIDRPVRDVMTKGPLTVPAGAMLSDAVDIMAERKISELPVVATDRTPLGLLDITDVLGIMPNVAA